MTKYTTQEKRIIMLGVLFYGGIAAAIIIYNGKFLLFLAMIWLSAFAEVATGATR